MFSGGQNESKVGVDEQVRNYECLMSVARSSQVLCQSSRNHTQCYCKVLCLYSQSGSED